MRHFFQGWLPDDYQQKPRCIWPGVDYLWGLHPPFSLWLLDTDWRLPWEKTAKNCELQKHSGIVLFDQDRSCCIFSAYHKSSRLVPKKCDAINYLELFSNWCFEFLCVWEVIMNIHIFFLQGVFFIKTLYFCGGYQEGVPIIFAPIPTSQLLRRFAANISINSQMGLEYWPTNLPYILVKCTRWFKVTFSSLSWRSLNPLEGSLNHPKKVTLNHQVGKYTIHGASWTWDWTEFGRWFDSCCGFFGKRTTRNQVQIIDLFMVSFQKATGWWFQIFFMFILTWGNDPIWWAYFSDGLVQPPTRQWIRTT